MAGAFNFTDELGSTIFLEFGKVILGEGGLPKTLPTFEYYVNKSAQVIAICDGVVQSVNFQPDRGDYEINFVPKTGSIRESAWMINQDHILGVNVHAGDHISAGQVLGTAGECWVAGIGRTEIMIYNRDTGKAFAPFALFDPSSITEYEAKVTTLMSDWETFKGDSSIFDEDKMVYPGCYNVSLP